MAKLTEGMQGFMNDYLEAKRSFYGWDNETFNEKANNFLGNIKNVKFYPKLNGLNIRGQYRYSKNRIWLAMDGRNVEENDVKTIAHELNHAFNHDAGKRMNLLNIEGKKISKNMRKYNLLSEVINEAETQVLFENERASSINTQSDRKFTSYKDLQPAFEMLCVSCNQDAATFLRGIEGKDIEGLVQYVGEHSGHSLEEAQMYIDELADELSKLEKTDSKDFNLEGKDVPAYRQMLQINEGYIKSSSLDENDINDMSEKLISIKNKPFYEQQRLEQKRKMLSVEMIKQGYKDGEQLDDVGRNDDKSFSWGDIQTGEKMKREYFGLDAKREKEERDSLQLPAASEVQNQTPPAPTMLENMPDLARINTPEETAKAYADISARVVEAPTISSQEFSGPSL